MLAVSSGALVSRDQIRREVWGEETFIDFDQALNFCIRQIRSVLGDTAQSPSFVETLPRRGDRFLAPVEIDAATHTQAALPKQDRLGIMPFVALGLQTRIRAAGEKLARYLADSGTEPLQQPYRTARQRMAKIIRSTDTLTACGSGEIGRRIGLKIRSSERSVWVQVPPSAPNINLYNQLITEPVFSCTIDVPRSAEKLPIKRSMRSCRSFDHFA